MDSFYKWFLELFAVSPAQGEWIEMPRIGRSTISRRSRPRRASGLKFVVDGNVAVLQVSRPCRASGLKYPLQCTASDGLRVSPAQGEWIEIYQLASIDLAYPVSPAQGEWIEILAQTGSNPLITSRPRRASGLNCDR